MHLVPSNSTLKPWCAYPEPGKPSRQHAAITAPASVTPITFFPSLEESSGLIGSLSVYEYARRPFLSRLLRSRRFGFGGGRFGELCRVNARIRLHLAQLDRRSAVRPGDNPPERY